MSERSKLAAVDLLPSPDEVRLRLAQNQTERDVLRRLQKLVRAAHQEKQRLVVLNDDIFPPSQRTEGE
jgi:hypothetical protein